MLTDESDEVGEVDRDLNGSGKVFLQFIVTGNNVAPGEIPKIPKPTGRQQGPHAYRTNTVPPSAEPTKQRTKPRFRPIRPGVGKNYLRTPKMLVRL